MPSPTTATDTLTGEDRSDRLDAALAAYLGAIDAGQTLDTRVWLADHPDLADDLAVFLDDHQHVARITTAPGQSDVGELSLGWPVGPESSAAADATAIRRSGEADPKAPPQDQAAGSRIRYLGDFELIRVLGRGGMGVVYLARQCRLGRLVALKMIRDGQLASAEDLKRFRNEAEAIASLDHPHLLKIFEVGEHHGRHYFTMPMITGGSLADRPGIFREAPRLVADLVATLADALHHAHQRGIIHRDLKPANILIDEAGRPFVADFGLARRLNLDGRVSTTDAILGTPGYMSPEQASGRGHSATTSSDIHGLGAILYTLLCGRPPFAGETPLETLLQVRDESPHPPTRVNRLVSRQLESICLKCLSKDPARRYSSAAALAEDLRRYLRGEPTEARPVGPLTRAAFWCRRRPAVAVMTAAITATLAVAAVAVFSAGREAVRQRDQAEALVRFLADDLLARSSDLQAPRRDITVVELLDRSAASVGRRFAGRPDLEATVRRLLADSFRALGRLDQAEVQLGKTREIRAGLARGDRREDLADSSSRAALHLARGQVDAGREQARRAFEGRRQLLGGANLATLESALLLAVAQKRSGRSQEAEALLQATHETGDRLHGPHHPLTLTALSNLAVLDYERGRWAEAEAKFRRLRDARLGLLGFDHPDSLFAAINLGAVLLIRGDAAGAIAVLEPSLETARRMLGEDHPATRVLLSNLGAARSRCRDRAFVSASPDQRCSSVGFLSPPGDSISLRQRNNRAGDLLVRGEVEAAESLFRDLLATAYAADPVDRADLSLILTNLAGCLLEAGKLAEADEMVTRALAIHESGPSPDLVRIANLKDLRVLILLAAGRYQEAEPLARELLDGRADPALRDHGWRLPSAGCQLGAALAGQGRFGEAKPYLLEGCRGLEADPETPPRRLRQARSWRDRLIQGDFGEANEP